MVFRQVVEALHRVEVVAYRQVAGAAFHLLAEVVALHHREGGAYRQEGMAAFHQLAEAVALHRVAVESLHHRGVEA